MTKANIERPQPSDELLLAMQNDDATAAWVEGLLGDPKAIPLELLKLSVWQLRPLAAAGIITLGQLAECSRQWLLGLPGFGFTGLYTVEALLADFDLHLAADARRTASRTRSPMLLARDEKVCRLWKHGMSAKDISECLGVTRTNVYAIVKAQRDRAARNPM